MEITSLLPFVENSFGIVVALICLIRIDKSLMSLNKNILDMNNLISSLLLKR